MAYSGAVLIIGAAGVGRLSEQYGIYLYYGTVGRAFDLPADHRRATVAAGARQIGTASTTLGPGGVGTAREPEARRPEERVVLGGRSLARAEQHQHVQVQPLPEGRLLARR